MQRILGVLVDAAIIFVMPVLTVSRAPAASVATGARSRRHASRMTPSGSSTPGNPPAL